MQKKLIEKLKKKWHVESSWDIIAIIVVFSISGPSIVFAKRLFFDLIGITDATPLWIKIIFWLIIVFPAYQVFLIIYGTLLGQFRFFWEKEKAMGRAIVRLFKRK